jgi:hypothetical protein
MNRQGFFIFFFKIKSSFSSFEFINQPPSEDEILKRFPSFIFVEMISCWNYWPGIRQAMWLVFIFEV